MNKIYALLLFTIRFGFAQSGAPATPYYNGFNWSLTGSNLKNELATKITTTHTNLLSYTPGVWDACKATDLDPSNSNNVLLIYGYENGTDGDVTNDRSRSKNANSGSNGDWNREHVYAKSLGTPVLLDGGNSTNGSSDAGEDAHHLRSSDVQRNNARGSLKFAPGSGNSQSVLGGWYPGDEWKGDVARMMMYMYLRYGNQCLPINVGTGTVTSTDANMLNLFLQWNIDDPVSLFEDNRNNFHGNTSNSSAQGNRNPFIDNPYIATLIWGGVAAENRWSTLNTQQNLIDANIAVFPNPSNNHKITIESSLQFENIQLININGQLMLEVKNPSFDNQSFSIDNLQQGFYFLKFSTNNQVVTKKVIIN